MSRKIGTQKDTTSPVKSKRLRSVPDAAVQQQAIDVAEQVRRLVEREGVSVFLSLRNDDEAPTAMKIILDSLVKAAAKNSMSGELIYRAVLLPLLNGLMAKGRDKKPKGDQRDLRLLAYVAYTTTKFLQEELGTRPELIRPIARYRDDFPVMRSLNPRNHCDDQKYLQSIQSGAALPWRTKRDSKWSMQGSQKAATEGSKEILIAIKDHLIWQNGKDIPLTSVNRHLYSNALEDLVFTREILTDQWFDCFFTKKVKFKTPAHRRARLKDIIGRRILALVGVKQPLRKAPKKPRPKYRTRGG